MLAELPAVGVAVGPAACKAVQPDRITAKATKRIATRFMIVPPPNFKRYRPDPQLRLPGYDQARIPGIPGALLCVFSIIRGPEAGAFSEEAAEEGRIFEIKIRRDLGNRGVGIAQQAFGF